MRGTRRRARRFPQSSDKENRQREPKLDARRERERLDDADAIAEPPHHRDLYGACEPREDREPDRDGRHPPADSLLWKRLNALPSVSLQCVNQPTLGIGCLSSAEPPSSRTREIDASMSSVSK